MVPLRSLMACLRQVSSMQVLLLLVLSVALYFGVALTSELIAGQGIDQQLTTLHADIGQLQTANQQLKAQVAQAQTDAFVDQQARDKLGYVQQGDTPVVFVNTPPAPLPPVPPAQPAPAHWQRWAQLLGLASR